MLKTPPVVRHVATGLCLLLSTVAWAANPASDRSTRSEEFQLRGYRGIRHSRVLIGEGNDATAVHSLTFDDSTHAQWFVSKLCGDFTLSQGITLREVALRTGRADAIDLGSAGLILPLLAPGDRVVTVVAGPAQSVVAQADRIASTPPLRRAALTHPLYLDKWDRYALGCWTKVNEAELGDFHNSLDDLFAWMGRMQVTAQLNTEYLTQDLATNDNLFSLFRRQFAAHGVNYQRVEWMANQVDLYNRNPFFVTGRNPDVAMRGDYYGERTLAANPYRGVQNATIVDMFRRTAGDANQMALLDPDGEIGPFDEAYWGLDGPINRREFVRFLQQVRQLSLADVSQRYTGRADAYRSWADVTLADWRTFYGWTDGAQDLNGAWRFRRDDRLEGFAQGWSLPGADEADWLQLHYPGNALVFALPSNDKPLWMRKTFHFEGRWPGRVYLSLAPLCKRAVQVFLNGVPLGAADPRYRTAWVWGQFDITEEARRGRPLTVVLRFAAGDCPQGPIFLTPNAVEDFPTADPRLNARRWDHLEFIDWAVAQAVGSTLATLRSVDPDRPIKVHAYGQSPWGWDTVARYGGYSHHTGSGAGWQWTEPQQYGAAYGLQDSSEPGSPMSSLRDFRGIWGSLIFMGKNAHDYFLSVHDITGDPAKRAYFEAKAPAIKLMGRAHVQLSPVAAIREQLRYRYEFRRWETWRYGVSPARGGEMVPLLNEVTLRQGNLDQFRAIIDEDLPCWDDQIAAALESYVGRGGILVLGPHSGVHTYLQRNAGAGPRLAGVRIGPPPEKAGLFTVRTLDSRLGGLSRSIRTSSRDGTTAATLQPAAGTDVLGVWPDGTPALTRRALGRGYVYCFGDTVYPGELIAGLAQAQGLATYAAAEGGCDLVRTLRSNNGTEDLLMVRGVGGKEATVRWTLEYPPARIYDPVTGRTIPARIDGHTATVTLKLDDWDFAWLAVRRPGCDEHFSHWFRRQTQIWSGLVLDAKAPAVPPYRHLDLNHDWRLAHAATWERAEALRPLDDAAAGMQPTPLIPWDEAQQAAGPCALYRCDFTLPARWQERSTLQLAVRGDVHSCRHLHGFDGRNALYLNGQPLASGARIDTRWFDVTAHLRPGSNRLEIVHQGPGLMPALMLVRSAVPQRTIDLAGPWRCMQNLQSETLATLPGSARGVFLYRDVEVPAAAKEQEIWLRASPACDFVIVNGRLRYWDIGHTLVLPKPESLEIDITPDLRCGQTNRIVLGNSAAMAGWQASTFDLRRVELALFAPGQWSWDGRGTRAALTPEELAAVARDAGRVQPYALLTPEYSPVARPAAPSATPPARQMPRLSALLDLAAPASGGLLADRGPLKVPLATHGRVTPFDDAGGRIRGVFLHGEGPTPGTLEIPSRFLRDLVHGEGVVVRVWLMPIANESPGGALLSWGSQVRWMIRDLDTTITLPSVPVRRQEVGTVIAQRRWQCLTLCMQNRQSDLYLNGIPVSRQAWNRALEPSDAPLYVGSADGKHDFLNAKLAALGVYSGSLTAAGAQALYRAERDAFLARPGTYDPENDVFRLKLAAGGGDEADVPGNVTMGPGVTFEHVTGRPLLAFDGQASHLLVRDSPRSRLFSQPYAFLLEFRPDPGASGTLFRRHHCNCLRLERDGTLTFDANIGQRNLVRFPHVVRCGEWNRLVLAYDGHVVTLEVNGARVGQQVYPGALYDAASDFPVVFLADNTMPGFPRAGNVRCSVRELRLAPWPADLSPER